MSSTTYTSSCIIKHSNISNLFQALDKTDTYAPEINPIHTLTIKGVFPAEKQVAPMGVRHEPPCPLFMGLPSTHPERGCHVDLRVPDTETGEVSVLICTYPQDHTTSVFLRKESE